MDLAHIIDCNQTGEKLPYSEWWEGMWLIYAANCFYQMGINVHATDIRHAPHWKDVKGKTQEMTREEFKKAMMDWALEHNCTSFRWQVRSIKQLEEGVSGERSIEMGSFEWLNDTDDIDDIEKFDKETD